MLPLKEKANDKIVYDKAKDPSVFKGGSHEKIWMDSMLSFSYTL